jgi:hypothetical protein
LSLLQRDYEKLPILKLGSFFQIDSNLKPRIPIA